MSLVLSIQCDEGLVLAADSAMAVASGNDVVNVWSNATKLFQIRDYNIGVLFFGSAKWGKRTINTMVQQFNLSDLGKPMSVRRSNATQASISPYEIFAIAREMKDFFSLSISSENIDTNIHNVQMGMIISGYSYGEFVPTQFAIKLPSQDSGRPIEDFLIDFGDRNIGLIFEGLPDAIYRLIYGMPSELLIALSSVNFSKKQKEIFEQVLEQSYPANLDFRAYGPVEKKLLQTAMDARNSFISRSTSWRQLFSYKLKLDGISLQEGLEIVSWLADTTIGLYRFAHSNPLVGGALDIAVITPSQFKWIRKKEPHF